MMTKSSHSKSVLSAHPRSLLSTTAVVGGVAVAAILSAGGCSVEPSANLPASVIADKDSQVESLEAYEEMQRYVANRVRPEHIRHSFRQLSGAQVDCVQVEKQPGTRDNEEEILTPPDSPFQNDEPASAEADSQGDEAFLSGGVDDSGAAMTCPMGTIPVRRVHLKDLVRFRNLSHYFHKQSSQMPPPAANGPSALHQYAHAANWNVTNLGAASWMNVWAPSVAASGEFSLSQLWVTRGSGSGLQSLEAGWQVAPSFYGDSRAHLFIYSTSDGYTTNAGGCYNLDCKRFVQTNSSVVVGGALTASQAGKAQYAIRLMYSYDAASKAWWLWIRRSTSATTDTAVGYYRASLFSAGGLGGASPRASMIDFGGEIIDDRSKHVSHTGTDMGAGAYPASGYGYTAYQRNAMYRGTDGTWRNASLTRNVDNTYCYDLAGPSFDSGGWNTYFYFGGPGYNTNCR